MCNVYMVPGPSYYGDFNNLYLLNYMLSELPCALDWPHEPDHMESPSDISSTL
jgi:hypothetical protein